MLGIKTEQQSGQPAYYVPQYAHSAGLDIVPVPVYYPEATAILEAGMKAGLRPRIHADELGPSGGARVAAAVGARSADHLVHVDAEGIAALDPKADALVVAFGLIRQGAVANQLGKHDRAEHLLNQALVLVDDIHDPVTANIVAGTVLGNLGVAAQCLGDLDLARSRYERALVISQMRVVLARGLGVTQEQEALHRGARPRRRASW